MLKAVKYKYRKTIIIDIENVLICQVELEKDQDLQDLLQQEDFERKYILLKKEPKKD